jgi:hypothetical protein
VKHLNLAFEKGRQIGRGEITAKVEQNPESP